MAAPRSRLDVARLLRAHDLPEPRVDESFVAVLAAQARDAAGAPVAAPPRHALKLAGAAVAVLASTVGVAVAANQGLFVPPDPQHSPPATTTSDVPAPEPLDDDLAEETDDRAEEPDASEAPAPHEDAEDVPDSDVDDEGVAAADADDSTPTRHRPGRTSDHSTQGGAGGQDSRDDGPTGDGSDDHSDDGPDESDSPEPEESESAEPETDEGAESSETSAPEPDEATESTGVDESAEDALVG